MEQSNKLLYHTTGRTTHHLWGLKEIAKGFQQFKVQDQVRKPTQYKPCFSLLPKSNALTFYLIKFPCEKHAIVKRPRNHIPYRGHPSIYYFPVRPPKCAQGSYQFESHKAGTASILNRSGACAIFHYHTFSVCQIFSQYNSRCALSLQGVTWLWKPSLLRWFLPLFTKEAVATLQLLPNPEQSAAKYLVKIPQLKIQT